MDYFFNTTKFKFESEFTEKVCEFSVKTWGIGAVKFSTLQQDKFLGNEFEVLGVPVTVKLDYIDLVNENNSKHHLSASGVDVYYDIKDEDTETTCGKPKLAINLYSATGTTKNNMWALLSLLASNMKTILEEGMDFYFERVPE